MLSYVRQAISTNGGTPASYSLIGAWRELVTAYGGTPTQYSVKGLMREAIEAVGGTPTQQTEMGLLKELLEAMGQTVSSYRKRDRYELLATTLALGPELLTNGSFGADANWTKTLVTIGSGVASFAGDGVTIPQIDQAVALQAGATYQVVFTVTSRTTGGVRARFAGGTVVSGTGRTAAGTYTEQLVAVTGNNTFRMAGTQNNAVLAVDNISLKKVL